MKIREILLEYNKDYLKNNFEKKYEQKKNKDHSLPNNTSFDEFLEKIEKPLRDQNKFQIIDSYMKWRVEKYVNNKIRYFEDIHSKTIPTLLTYDALKRKNKLKPEHKDITKIKSLNDLMDIVDEYREEDTKSGKEKDKEIEQKFYESGEAILLYNDSNYKIVVPKTERASCYFGRNTRWCTAATKSTNLFDYYNEQGNLYIIIDKKNNKRYQLHYETNQFMDQNDNSIDEEEFIQENPELAKIIANRLSVPNYSDFLVTFETYRGSIEDFFEIILTNIAFTDNRGDYYSTEFKHSKLENAFLSLSEEEALEWAIHLYYKNSDSLWEASILSAFYKTVLEKPTLFSMIKEILESNEDTYLKRGVKKLLSALVGNESELLYDMKSLGIDIKEVREFFKDLIPYLTTPTDHST